VNEDGLPHLRSSLRQRPALRIAELSPDAPRLVEGPPQARLAPPPAEPPRFSFWRFSLRALPIIVALVSTALLAYFLLSERSSPLAQSQQEGSQPARSGAEAADDLDGTRSSAQESPQQLAQNDPQPGKQQAQQQQSPPQLLPMPNDDRLLLMIMSSLTALNQANLTGNYTVLRELAAPGFQQVNSAERLAQLFAKLRGRHIDLTPILLFQPKLYRKPEMNNAGMLRITGFFPTAPERVNFDLIFQPVQGQWRLFGIGVDTARPQPPPPQPQGGPAPSAGNGAPSESQAAKTVPPAPKPKPKPKSKETTAEPQASSADVDVRDRIDQPPATPPAPEKPKQKSIWNPFGR
jgi:hypothetical protein